MKNQSQANTNKPYQQRSTSLPTNWQRAQNASLRPVTGCHAISNEDHIHQETNLLPIKEHIVHGSPAHLLIRSASQTDLWQGWDSNVESAQVIP